MARRRTRTQPCSAPQARKRREHAHSFLDVAELVAEQRDPDLEYSSVAASLAVLAGIAAADAVCCSALGERSRSQDHRDAEALVEEIPAGGKQASIRLRRLLDLRDSAHYGFLSVSGTQLKQALRQANT